MKMRLKFKKNKEGQTGGWDDGPAWYTAVLYYPERTCELRQVKKDYLHWKAVIAMSIWGAIMLSSVT